MSSALLSNLPRFDHGETSGAPGRLQVLLGKMPVEAPPPPEPEIAEPAPPPPVDLGPLLAEVEALISGLSQAMTRMETSSSSLSP